MSQDEYASRLIVAIDGPAGTGKSTLAKAVAKHIGGVYIDTGAMYRSVTANCLHRGISPSDETGVAQISKDIKITFAPDDACQRVFVDNVDHTTRIREKDVNDNVSTVAANSAVRENMVAIQRALGNSGKVVMEGRDIGSNVFPNADFKFFLVADDKVRAKRRLDEMVASGMEATLDEVLQNLVERDRQDSSRKTAPLIKAPGAIEIDTSEIGIDEVLHKMIQSMVR